MIADLSFAFHWPLPTMDAMYPGELMAWHCRMVERVKAANGGK